MNRSLPIALLTTVLLTGTVLSFHGHETIADLGDISHPNGGKPVNVVKPVASIVEPAVSVVDPLADQAPHIRRAAGLTDQPKKNIVPAALPNEATDQLIHAYMRLIKRRHDRLETERQHFLETERRLKGQMAEYYLKICNFDQRIQELYPQEVGKFKDIVAFIEQENIRKAS